MSEVRVEVNRDVQSERKLAAARQRQSWLESGTFVVNLVSSPGAGKTTLLQEIGKYWSGRFRVAVLVGDLATDRDAERLRPYLPVEQLTTGGACHLELPLVQVGLTRLPQEVWDFLIIENIGNLVCPASHDLGEHLRVVALSSTEGDDKPGKYPKMFRTSQAMVITKADLLPYVPFDPASADQDARKIQPELRTFMTSALKRVGIAEFCSFLETERDKMLEKSRTLEPNDCVAT